MKKRLQSVLAHAGIASRRRSAGLIEDGLVEVDGKVVREKGYRLDPSLHRITVMGRPLSAEEQKKYILLYKPAGVITTVKDTHGRKKVTDLVPGLKERVYPVGRLDKDTTGLLVLTNDGKLAHRLSHPSFEVEKEYRAEVSGKITPEKLRRLSEGVFVEGKKTSPCSVKVLEEKKGRTLLAMTIHEGRKRQIRSMISSIGAKVVSLERVRYAGLTLEGLTEGRWRYLTPAEVLKLKGLSDDKRT
ncbi:MAG: pseudouridine synthase [Candidatus Omnitrophica bacterium]|nr:pseudouridine synthase [Candidatus Omnitrophota bacterium]